MKRIEFRFTLRRHIAAIAALWVALAILRSLFFGPSPTDVLYSLILGHDTTYAPGFSESKWRWLRLGASTEEIASIMGPPLGKQQYPGQIECWAYSASPGDRDYWIRNIVFENGKATRFVDEFYVD